MSRIKETCYLIGANYSHGRLDKIDTIPELASNTDILETLYAYGLDTYSKSDQDPGALSELAVKGTLQKASLKSTDIDAIVFCTTGYYLAGKPWETMLYSHMLKTLLNQLGMLHVIPYGISFSQCVNFVTAIEMACGLLANKRHNTILIVVTDVLSEGDTRIVAPGISVTSDIASSCIITNKVIKESNTKYVSIESIVQSTDWNLLDVDPSSDFPEYFKRTAQGIANVSNILNEDMLCTSLDFSQMITNSINRSVLRIYNQATSTPIDKIYSDNISKLAHCDASDILVNFADYIDNSDVADGGLIKAIASGPYIWGGFTARAMGHT